MYIRPIDKMKHRTNHRQKYPAKSLSTRGKPIIRSPNHILICFKSSNDQISNKIANKFNPVDPLRLIQSIKVIPSNCCLSSGQRCPRTSTHCPGTRYLRHPRTSIKNTSNHGTNLSNDSMMTTESVIDSLLFSKMMRASPNKTHSIGVRSRTRTKKSLARARTNMLLLSIMFALIGAISMNGIEGKSLKHRKTLKEE